MWWILILLDIITHEAAHYGLAWHWGARWKGLRVRWTRISLVLDVATLTPQQRRYVAGIGPLVDLVWGFGAGGWIGLQGDFTQETLIVLIWFAIIILLNASPWIRGSDGWQFWHAERFPRAPLNWREAASPVAFRQSGQALLIVVIWLPLLLGMAGLALTLGTVFYAQARLQNAVDAGALAAAQAAQQGLSPNGQTAVVTQDDPGAQAITFVRTTYHQTPAIRAQALTIVPGSFLALFGVKTFTVHAQAVATYGTAPPFYYAVFQGDPHPDDPPLTIHGANIITALEPFAANVHSNNGLVIRGASIITGTCSASATVTLRGVGGCSDGTPSHVPQIAMPLWSQQQLVASATHVIGSPHDLQGYTFNGATQFTGNWVVYGNVNISGAFSGPGSIVAIGGTITIHGAATIGTSNGLGVCLAALPLPSVPNTPENIIIRGAHILSGILYAPTGTISLEGADSIQGAVVGYRVQLGGAGSVLYDPHQLSTLPQQSVVLVS